MSETLTRDNLIAGDFPLITKTVTIVGGAGALARGTVLGKITKGAATKANAGAGAAGANTGNGVLTLDSTTPVLAKAKVGAYIVRIVRAAIAQVGTTPVVPAQLALAQVIDPDGISLGFFEVPASGSTALTWANQVKFTIKEGSTPFAAGDGFSITIAVGSKKHKIVNSTFVDGADVPDAVLAEAVAASDNDQYALAYLSGTFNQNALTFGGSDTYATHEAALRALGIHLKDALGA